MTGLTEDFSKQSPGEWRSLKLQLVLRRYLLTLRLPGPSSSWLTPTFWDVLGVLTTSPATPPASQTSVIREQFNRILLRFMDLNNDFLLKQNQEKGFYRVRDRDITSSLLGMIHNLVRFSTEIPLWRTRSAICHTENLRTLELPTGRMRTLSSFMTYKTDPEHFYKL